MESLPFRASPESQEPELAPIIRMRKRTLRHQFLLLLGMGASGLLGIGCQSLPDKPKPSTQEKFLTTLTHAKTAAPKTEPPKEDPNTRQYASYKRIEIVPGDDEAFDFIRKPIVLTPYSSNPHTIEISNSSMPISWTDYDREDLYFRATDFADLRRSTDREGDIELALYHYRATHEWPAVRRPEESPELIHDGRLAVGDWIFEHTRRNLLDIVTSPLFAAMSPRLFFNEDLKARRKEEEEIHLDMTFNLTQNPREKPIPLAMLQDNANQLVSLGLRMFQTDNQFAKALIDTFGLAGYHFVSRIFAHLCHETAHAHDAGLCAHFQGYRTVAGIPLPAFFPRTEFEVKDEGFYSVYTDDYWRDRFLASIAAGPNQLTLANRQIYRRNLRSHDPMNVYDGWSWLVQNSLMPGSAPLGYMISDKIREGKQGNRPGDINQYIEFMRQKGIHMDVDQMIQNNAITLAANAQTYQAIIAIANHFLGIVKGLTGVNIGRIPDMPRGVQVLGAEVNWPLFEHYLTPNGELLHAMVPINQQRQNPIMLEVSTDLDGTQRGARVDLLRSGITVAHRTPWFMISGSAYLATHRSDLTHFRAITGRGRLSVPILDTGTTLTLQLTHLHQMNQHGDPMALIEGIKDGTEIELMFNLRW